MRKHITLSILDAEGWDRVLVKVDAQTHVNTGFGHNGSNRFSVEGYTIGSNSRPSRDQDKRSKTFWLRGSCAEKNNRAFYVTREELAGLRRCVEIYNVTEFVDPAPVAAPMGARTNGIITTVG